MISIPIWLFVILIILATPIALIIAAYSLVILAQIIKFLEDIVIRLNGDEEEEIE